MNRDILKQVIIDQRELYLNCTLVKREYSLDANVNYCFVGIRRTGKSYMLYQQIQQLLAAGISPTVILYVNFEDERLLEMQTEDLNTILEIGLELAGGKAKPYIFLDEVQNIHGWEKFVRRLADLKYRINLTGSNSKMLSKEIASTLGGRFLIMQIFPYSLKEYLQASNINYHDMLSTQMKADIIGLYNQFVDYGAFPELVDIKQKKAYLSSIYQTIYIGDIIARNKLSNEFGVRLLVKKVAESLMRPVSFSRLSNILKSAGAAIGKQTVINYMGFVTDAYLIFAVHNYAAKLVDKETSPKYYFMDTGIVNLLLLDSVAARLENLVALELCRRYGCENVYYYAQNMEVDFYVPCAELAIQVCYSVFASIDTREREFGALVKLHKLLPEARCLVITNSEEAEVDVEGMCIQVVPAWKWCLGLEK